MNKLVLILVILVLLFIVYYVYVTSRLFEWDFNITSVKPINIEKSLTGGGSVNIEGNLILNNPSVFSFSLKSISIALFYNNIQVASTTGVIEAISIASHSSTSNPVSISVPVKLELLDIASKYATGQDFTLRYVVSYKILGLFTAKTEGYYTNKKEELNG